MGNPNKSSKKLIVKSLRVLDGEPVIKGTRVTAERIAFLFKNGYDIDEIAKDYPQLTRGKIEASLRYALNGSK